MEPKVNIALEAARAGCKELLSFAYRLDQLEIKEKGPSNYVTQLDKRVESIIIDSLKSKFKSKENLLLYYSPTLSHKRIILLLLKQLLKTIFRKNLGEIGIFLLPGKKIIKNHNQESIRRIRIRRMRIRRESITRK